LVTVGVRQLSAKSRPWHEAVNGQKRPFNAFCLDLDVDVDVDVDVEHLLRALLASDYSELLAVRHGHLLVCLAALPLR
jgi:hypothetical protein